jgi:hypothetical protein
MKPISSSLGHSVWHVYHNARRPKIHSEHAQVIAALKAPRERLASLVLQDSTDPKERKESLVWLVPQALRDSRERMAPLVQRARLGRKVTKA